jgi:hypothetical protein
MSLWDQLIASRVTEMHQVPRTKDEKAKCLN